MPGLAGNGTPEAGLLFAPGTVGRTAGAAFAVAGPTVTPGPRDPLGTAVTVTPEPEVVAVEATEAGDSPAGGAPAAGPRALVRADG
ncbi:MAG: hypothetical protein NVSMB4_12500 [Acidimicrobiales bacterium]